LQVLHDGQKLPTRLTLRFMRRVTRSEPSEIARVRLYRHRYFGTPFLKLVKDVMRDRSFWTVVERQLFAAYTSKLNRCAF
jgi:hypothetical protein